MSSSILPWKWVIESLADNPDVDTSILTALVDRFPDVISDSSGVAVRERLALRYLEELSGFVGDDSLMLDSAAKIDVGLSCEEVLRSKVAATIGDGKGKSCLDGGDFHQFILLKKATLPKSSIDLLKEKILGSQHHSSDSKGCNDSPKVSSPGCVNRLTSNNHGDHDGIKKIIRSMKHASPLMKKLSITRRYRKFKNLDNNTPLSTVGGALQKISSTQQHSLKQQVPDEDNTRTNASAEFHDIGMQPPKDNLSGFVPAPNCATDNFEGSLQSAQQSQKQNSLHDDRADLQDVADGACDDAVQLLEQQSSMPRSSSAQNLCIKCSTSGQLLNCHGDGCSRSFHESCLGLLSSVEQNGLFFCPFCAYRNARMMFEKSKRKALEARKNLFSLYDVDPTVHGLKRKNYSAKIMPERDQANANHGSSEHLDLSSDQSFRNSSGSQKHDAQNPETSNSRFGREITQNQLNGEDDTVCKIILPCRETIECHIDEVVQDTPINLRSDSGGEHEGTKVTEEHQAVDDHQIHENGCLSHERNGEACVSKSITEVADQEQISLEAAKRSPLKAQGEFDHNAKRKALASHISGRFSKRNKTIKTDNNHGVVKNQPTKASSIRELRKNKYRHNQCLTPKQSPCRRTKLIWKPEEEHVLEDAMQKIPKNEDGSIPWTKILEYGRGFLHESRNPIDLKDKWRNMQKKEAKKQV